MNDLGDVLATYWTAVATTDQRLGAVTARDEVMTRTQQAVALTIHADCTVLTGLGQTHCRYIHTRPHTHTHTVTTAKYTLREPASAAQVTETQCALTRTDLLEEPGSIPRVSR